MKAFGEETMSLNSICRCDVTSQQTLAPFAGPAIFKIYKYNLFTNPPPRLTGTVGRAEVTLPTQRDMAATMALRKISSSVRKPLKLHLNRGSFRYMVLLVIR